MSELEQLEKVMELVNKYKINVLDWKGIRLEKIHTDTIDMTPAISDEQLLGIDNITDSEI